MENIKEIKRDIQPELKQDLIEILIAAISLIESSPKLPCFQEVINSRK
jgi:hypothetical protein